MQTAYSPFDVAPANPYRIVAAYTLAASVTGAIPVPAASAAIIAENGAMIAQIESAYGGKITIGTVVQAMGLAGSANMIGRQLFIEGARLISWGTGQVWAQVALSALGATTAGIQTFIVGCLAIEIAKNGGKALDKRAADNTIADARARYDEFCKFWREHRV